MVQGMENYERILFEQLQLHHVAVSTKLTVPGQVQIVKKGKSLGRFSLDDVFEGDFSGVTPGEPTGMANIERTLSTGYDMQANVGVSGPWAGLGRGKAELAANGVHKMQLTALNGTLQEIDHGILHRALKGSTRRDPGPMGWWDHALVIVAVASVTEFSMMFDGENGGRVKLGVEAADKIAAEAGVQASANRAGGLKITYPSPIPFAARLWLVKTKTLSGGFSITTPDGPTDVLGDSGDPRSAFQDVGIGEGPVYLD